MSTHLDWTEEICLTCNHDDRSRLTVSVSAWAKARQLAKRGGPDVDFTGVNYDQARHFVRALRSGIDRLPAETDDNLRSDLEAIVQFVEGPGRKGVTAQRRYKGSQQAIPVVAGAALIEPRRGRRGLTDQQIKQFTVVQGRPQAPQEHGVVILRTSSRDEDAPTLELPPSVWERIRKLANLHGYSGVNPNIVRPADIDKFCAALEKADAGSDRVAVQKVISLCQQGRGLSAKRC
jgi:hypothetical protein